MFKVIKLFFFTFFLAYNCYAIELLPEDAIVLEEFFRIMLEKSEGGYVFFEKKPICIHGFHAEDYFLQENDRHLDSVFLREGALKWKALNENIQNQNIIIHVYNNEDALAKNYIHILFINKRLCLDTINSNLPLFQYVLGPDITAKRLLDKLTDPNLSFHSILNNDKVLIGILLGFGTQNSLYVSRIENLEKELFSAEQPPYKSQLSRMGDVRSEFRHMLLPKNAASIREISNAQPSFGYSALKEENQSLNKKINISSVELSKQSPKFIFGRLKGHKETDRIVSELEITQIKIKELLSSNTFLKDVLEFIYPKEKIIIYSDTNGQLMLDELEIKDTPYLIAANIWKTFKDEDEEYRQSFILGMKSAELNSEYVNASIDTFKYDKLKALSKIKSNLKEADTYFNQLDKETNIISVLPFKLYYRTIQEGNGFALDQQTNVSIHYSIQTPDNRNLVNTWMSEKPHQINLAEVIPGFAWGMKGMKIGELREIYIHPSLAYGIYTTLDKGIYLRAYVQLFEINEHQKNVTFPELTILDLNNEVRPTIDSELREEAKKVGYANGFKLWDHYKKSNLYTLSNILEWMDRFQMGMDADISSEQNQNTINRLHWNIYHSKTTTRLFFHNIAHLLNIRKNAG